MSEIYDILDKMIDNADEINNKGIDPNRVINYGGASTITPTKSGTLVVGANADSSTGVPPLIRVLVRDGVGNEYIACDGVGIASSGIWVTCNIQVKAGVTYFINTYRCTLNTSVLFY